MSKKDRRRVSFAPDPELTMIHHFEKVRRAHGRECLAQAGTLYAPAHRSPCRALQPQDDDNSAGHPSPLGAAPSPDPPARASARRSSGPPDSPGGQVNMDLTLTVGQARAAEEDVVWGGFAAGDVTAALPSLGDLVRVDEEENNFAGADAAQPGNITAAIPRYGALVEEDEEGGGAADHDGMDLTMPVDGAVPAPAGTDGAAATPEAAPAAGATALPGSPDLLDMFAPSPAPPSAPAAAADDPSSALRPSSAQVGKWGFVPGDDDTMNLDLELHGEPACCSITPSSIQPHG